jgi:hypothetical protein
MYCGDSLFYISRGNFLRLLFWKIKAGALWFLGPRVMRTSIFQRLAGSYVEVNRNICTASKCVVTKYRKPTLNIKTDFWEIVGGRKWRGTVSRGWVSATLVLLLHPFYS